MTQRGTEKTICEVQLKGGFCLLHTQRGAGKLES